MPGWLTPSWRAGFLLYAAAQFVVLTIIAMLVYPGGAQFDRGSDGYLFFQNFFSDLGATVTYSGLSNTTSHVLFGIALGTVGVALMLFSTSWKVVVARRQAGRAFGTASQVLAIIAGVGFIGIAATPWDRVLDAHNLFVQIAFGFLLAYVVCLIVIQIRNDWSRVFIGVNLAYLVVLVAYVVILFGGPGLEEKDGFEFQVAAQKIIVYTSILNLALQALPFWRNRERR